MRKLLHEDQWPQGCSTCEEMEKSDLKSMRFDYVLDTDNYFCKNKVGYDREIASKKLQDCLDNTDHSVTSEGLRHVEFRFSTACNFSCLHCSKVYSLGWTKKLKNYIPDKEDELYDLRQLLGTEHRHGPNDRNEMSLTTDEALKIVEDLNENFPNLAYVDVAGGEVLYQKQFFPTLRKLAEHPNAKNIHLSFHTNFNADFSVMELSDVLSFFGKSTIIISADAGKTFYSYFRHGGSWDKLKQNVNEFRDYNNFTYVDVSCTTSIYQMFDIYDVFESFFELGLNFDASIVQTPQYLDPSLIMYDFYDETMEDIRKTYKLIERMEKKAKSKMDLIKGNDARKWLDYIVNYIKNTKISYNHFNRWLIYRIKSDIIWKQDFNQFF